jgi:parvulin-like peptidyl-prolyl isomerase
MPNAMAAPFEPQSASIPNAVTAPIVGGANIPIPPQGAPATTQAPPPQIFTNAQILARVGSETILASDVVPLAEEALQQKLAEIPKEQRDSVTAEQYEKLKAQFTKGLLGQLVEIKIRYADALANIPKENLPKVKESILSKFDEVVLKKLMEKYQATTRTDLEAKMAAAGQSLDRQRQMYLERALAGGWEEQHVKDNREIPVSETFGYYQEHIDDFKFPSKARWEELMVSFDRFNSREEAERAIAQMGNEVLRGADFAAVAKAQSHGPTKSKGGAYDWTTKGSLVSKVLDEAIFGLPLNRMSQILESDQGFHIVRVVERVDAGTTSFREAQVGIRKKLRDEHVQRQKDEFLAKIKQRTPVWTIYDSQTDPATPGEAAIGGRATTVPR